MNRKHTLAIVAWGLVLWGCSTSRHGAQYGWLRKQGPVKEAQRLLPAAGVQAATASEINRPPGPFPNIAFEAPVDYLESAEPALAAAAQPEPTAFHSIETGQPLQVVPAIRARPDTGYYEAHEARWNAKAIAALPVAVATLTLGFAVQGAWILLIGGAIAFALGLIGSRQCRDREDRGKGLAIAGMALGAIALFLGGLTLLWGA
ncbi:MAG: DUF4190 domain-containing protein [Bacteroidetes bacterium]|nr:DUF4190 domain-containing protein [Bacteroidota bacterium]MBS1940086.1 DUF4190 domain-containing protein [Bacteroidota bacterium]